MQSIRISAPATSANLGSGFDICGLALANPSDEMEVSISDADAVRSAGRYAVPEELEGNSCGPVIKAMRKDFGIRECLEITIDKRIRPGSGLGSSAASAAGAAYSIDRLFGLGLGAEQLVHYASLGEKVSAGVPHVDNVAPCILGGFTVVVGMNPLRIKRIQASDALEAIIVLPEHGKASTKTAREVLPGTVSRKDSQYNLRCLSSLICSMLDGDMEGVAAAMDDRIVEPARERAGLLPHLHEIRDAGRRFGYGVAASGAGPAILLLGRKGSGEKESLLSEIDGLFKEEHKIIASGVSNRGIMPLD